MSAPEYPKIDTLFDRRKDFTVDVERVRRPEFLVPRDWLVTEKIDGTNVRVSLEQVTHCAGEPGCECDEPKEAWGVRFYGHKANSQMPTFLLDHLQRTFTLEGLKSLWRCKPSCKTCLGTSQADPLTDPPKPLKRCPNIEPYPIVLYGEGYGARIQKGGDYRRGGDVSCRLFDVLIGGIWLRRADVADVTRQLNVQPVPMMPIVERGSPAIAARSTVAVLADIVDVVRDGIPSILADLEGTPRQAEGVVASTDPPLFDSRGRRLTFKLKTRDFVAGKR